MANKSDYPTYFTLGQFLGLVDAFRTGSIDAITFAARAHVVASEYEKAKAKGSK